MGADWLSAGFWSHGALSGSSMGNGGRNCNGRSGRGMMMIDNRYLLRTWFCNNRTSIEIDYSPLHGFNNRTWIALPRAS